jgi:hypothetical protein
MAKIFFLLISLFTFLATRAQIYTGPFRSKQNPYYWKNKSPRADYWQQDVHYKIDAILDDSNDVLAGKVVLKYYNNSPDTLNEVFFHVNENAFTPGSYYHNLHLNNKSKPKFGKNAKNGLGTVVSNIKVNNNSVTPVLDNTVFKLKLPMALLPNDSTTIEMDFQTYFDIDAGMRRRMKIFKTQNNLKHFDAVHWYPQICVYDSKFGWTTDQHLDKEFYNNFGTFDVSLQLPQHYVMDATGSLLNENEVYPDSTKQKLKLSNFFNRKPTDSITRPIPYSKNLKTWKYNAVNVHNFAFTADPLYRFEEVSWNGIKAIALVQEQNAQRWKGAAGFAMSVIKVYSEDFGMYAWPKIIVADANDGMEYPMITLDNGFYPQNQQLLAHEIGHMWFYGMLGSNETYRASMDEGFTQFLTIWVMDKLTGAVKKRVPPVKWMGSRLKPYLNRYERLYNPYVTTHFKGYDEQLNTHSCAFNGAIRHGGNYGLVYYKTGVMLYNLKYTLGDSLFLKSMKNYVAQWKMCHPYPEDFRNSVIKYTHNDLNWFFDQWLESTKSIDYQVNKPKFITNNKDSLIYELSLSRKGRMHMPLDLTVTDESGKQYNYHIPNTWFVKKTPNTLLPKWYGWDLLQPTYKTQISVLGKIKSIQIDTTNTLADIDLRNNRWHVKNPVKLNLFVPNNSSWDKTDKLIRPELWYNAYDGLQLGFNFQKKSYATLCDYDLAVLGNTGLLQGAINDIDQKKFNKLSYTFNLRSNFNKYVKYSYLNFQSMFMAGMVKNTFGIDKIVRKQDDQNPRLWIIGANIDQMFRPRSSDTNYVLLKNNQEYNKLHTNLNLFADRKYLLKNKPASFRIDLRTPFLLSQYNYYFVQLQHNFNTIYKKLEFRTKLYTRLVHSNGSMPSESSLRLNGGNTEDAYTNKYYRAKGVFPIEWQNHDNVLLTQYGGGLNLRGLAAWAYDPRHNNGLVHSGASANFEMDFDQIFKIKPIRKLKYISFDTYIFGDAAVYNSGNFNEKTTQYSTACDAGLGTMLKINFGSLDIKPLNIRCDVPILVASSVKNSSKTHFIIGINRCF